LDAVTLLLTRGADATAATHCNGTPLHSAKNAEIAEALLTAGSDPNAHCWERHFDEETLGWHLTGNPLHNVGNNADIVQTLVRHGAKVDAAEHITGRTPLHYAAARGFPEAVKALLDLGADPNAVGEMHGYSVRWRMSPLHYAAASGHERAVEILVRARAKINAMADYVQDGGNRSRISYQLSPLHYAAREGHENVIRSLLHAGARANARGGPERKTAAEMARAAGHEKVALILGT
jgi:ankyrin repeat protein